MVASIGATQRGHPSTADTGHTSPHHGPLPRRYITSRVGAGELVILGLISGVGGSQEGGHVAKRRSVAEDSNMSSRSDGSTSPGWRPPPAPAIASFIDPAKAPDVIPVWVALERHWIHDPAQRQTVPDGLDLTGRARGSCGGPGIGALDAEANSGRSPSSCAMPMGVNDPDRP